jgi:hypothetical protein
LQQIQSLSIELAHQRIIDNKNIYDVLHIKKLQGSHCVFLLLNLFNPKKRVNFVENYALFSQVLTNINHNKRILKELYIL